jgi:hypothetical protein
VIVTGLGAQVATALADDGVDFGTLTTTADLEDGIREGQRILHRG